MKDKLTKTKQDKGVSYNTEKMQNNRMEEAHSVYRAEKRQGEYTIEDYYALPDDRRVELIDGVFYDMSCPTFVHQGIGGEIYRQIANFIVSKKGKCKVRTAPVDVRLDCDDKTIVQPDVLIVCDPSKIMRWGVMGAPDFILEVLSPSTRRKDCTIKLSKYMTAGVREYWIIDPEKRKLIVYHLEEDVIPAVYGLEGSIPVRIYDGELKIDLNLVAENIE